MREYETIFVTRPDGSESQTNLLLEKVNSIIERHGGTIIQQKNWGKKDLAYQVKKYDQGVYHYYNYSGDSETIYDLERSLKLHDLPMKYLTVKLADKVDVEARKRDVAKQEEIAAATQRGAVSEPLESREEVEVKTPEETEGGKEVGDAQDN